LFGHRVLQTAQRRAINMRLFRNPQRRAVGRIEHPLRDLNEHRIDRRLRKSAEEHHIGVGTASPACQNTATVPTVPRIIDLPGLKGDTVGLLQRDCNCGTRSNRSERVTAAGVSAGIDAAFHLASLVRGQDTSEQIQLQIEYDPQPPFQCGSANKAPKSLVQRLTEASRATIEARRTALISNPVNLPREPSICVLGLCVGWPTKRPTAGF